MCVYVYMCVYMCISVPYLSLNYGIWEGKLHNPATVCVCVCVCVCVLSLVHLCRGS